MTLKNVLLIPFVLFVIPVKAYSWYPYWNEMLDSAGVIALVRFESTGALNAEATVQAVYKGAVIKGERILVSRYINPVGPFGEMKKGELHVLFLTQIDPSTSLLKKIMRKAESDPALLLLTEAISKSKAYATISASAGDLHVKGKSVQYDLTECYYKKEHKYHSLQAFEDFLSLYFNNTPRDSVFQTLISRVNSNPSDKETSHDLMQLALLGYHVYHPVFEKLVASKYSDIRYATAALLANIRNTQSRNLLINLLQDYSGKVYHSVMKRFRADDPQVIIPMLVSRMRSIEIPPEKPSWSPMDRRLLRYVWTFGELGNELAVPAMLPLLETVNVDAFKILIRNIRKCGSRAYVPYVLMHLDSVHDNLAHTLGQIICEDSLTECIPALMRFVAATPGYADGSYALACFNTDTIRSFLLADFTKGMVTYKQNQIAADVDWVKSYTTIFNKLNMPEVKPVLYDFMYEFYGINQAFKTDTALFRYKKLFEDSITRHANALFSKRQAEQLSIKTVAFVYRTDSGVFLRDYKMHLNSARVDFKHVSNILGNNGFNRLNVISWDPHRITIDDYSDYLDDFIDYLSAVADYDDIMFMQQVSRYGYADNSKDEDRLNIFIDRALIGYEMDKQMRVSPVPISPDK